ncbi:MAG: 30S ribosomal protein S6 [Desulfobacteraceae bacterium]|nr:30S ribosomal protein S6 [Desulfobacteraceae bacterium]
MRRYETIIIIDPDLSEEARQPVIERIEEIISQKEGVLIKQEHWGVKKLAYEIKKKPRGYYAKFDYCGMGSLVSELERFFRIDDRLMKFLTVQLDPTADVEKIQSEAVAESSQQVKEQTGSAAAPQEKNGSGVSETQAAQKTETGETESTPGEITEKE